MQPQPFMHPTFGTVLNNFTSDHTWQSISATCVSKAQQPLVALRVATWNMLENCRSTEDFVSKFPNNPMNISEHNIQHSHRKQLQLNELEQMIQSAKPEQLDCILLQEVDWIFNKQLLAEYGEKLASLGWGHSNNSARRALRSISTTTVSDFI